MVALTNPFRRGARGWDMLGQQNHAAGGEKGSIVVGMFVSHVKLAKSLPSGSFLFLPERT